MKYTWILIVGLLLCAGAVLSVLRNPEDSWLCGQGQWVRHGQPSNPMPEESCP
ncbi:MAG: hypothetical protein V1926_05975 [Candidatus Peregrinibacteria bacterium]